MSAAARLHGVLALLAVVAATGGFLSYALTRPLDPDQRTVQLDRVHHYSVVDVRRAFTAHGIRLRYATPGVVLTLSVTPPPVPDSSLYVDLATGGTMSWGPKPGSGYDEPVGNLLVHYGGRDAHMLLAVESAVGALR